MHFTAWCISPLGVGCSGIQSVVCASILRGHGGSLSSSVVWPQGHALSGDCQPESVTLRETHVFVPPSVRRSVFARPGSNMAGRVVSRLEESPERPKSHVGPCLSRKKKSACNSSPLPNSSRQRPVLSSLRIASASRYRETVQKARSICLAQILNQDIKILTP